MVSTPAPRPGTPDRGRPDHDPSRSPTRIPAWSSQHPLLARRPAPTGVPPGHGDGSGPPDPGGVHRHRPADAALPHGGPASVSVLSGPVVGGWVGGHCPVW